MCPDLKVSIDGAMGNVTRAAIARIVEKGRVGDLVVSYCERRMRFMRSLKHWPTFKNGWTRRVMGKKTGAQPGQDNGVVDYALAMVYGADLQTRPHQIGSFPEEEMGGKALPADMATLKTVEGVGAVTASATGTLVVLGQVMDELSPLVDAPILGDSIKVIMAVLGCTSAALLVYSAIRNLSAKRQGV